MKAFILAAGRGERLRPITDKIPKCLVPIKGTPILGIWLALCKRHGIGEVLINLHHLSHAVEEYIDRNDFGVTITKFYEPVLLGTAGTVLANRDFVKNEKNFFIFYGDTLVNIDLKKMLHFHESHNSAFTMALFHSQRPKNCGIAEIDEHNVVTSFTEKAPNPKSDLSNAGTYIAQNDIFDSIPRKAVSDFGFDVLPRLTGKMYGYLLEEKMLDVGTPEHYERAQREWRGI